MFSRIRRLLDPLFTRRNMIFSGLVLIVLLSAAFTTPVFAQESNPCDQPANPIVAENCQPGTDDWVITQIGAIEGFVSTTSAAQGETIDFYVNTSAPRFDLLIYRSGYYGGKGARLIQTITDIPGQVQPGCFHEPQTGFTSCSNWSVSYSLPISDEWTSGAYFGKLVRSDDGGENFVIFVVRDDRPADILYQQSVTTYQAYNYYAGYSVYKSNEWDVCPTVAVTNRAVKVSFDRPYLAPMTEFNMYFHAEYPMVSWLESQGYDVTYSTNLDTHRSGTPGEHNRLLDHKMFLISGHDEYWTQEMWDAVVAARDSGVSIAVFSANTAYWRIRFEDDPQTGNALRTMITYKSTESGPADPSGHPTGTWRDRNGVNQPENALFGIMYMGDNSSFFFPIRVTAEQAKDRLYRNTGLQDMPPDSYINIGRYLVGWEWDQVVDNGLTPENLVVLAESPVNGKWLLDDGRDYSIVKEGIANTTRYTAPSGAQVFAAGTIHWALGLAVVEPNPLLQQITYNLLADMGVQPATPADSLVLDGETFSGNPAIVDDIYIQGQGSDPVFSDILVTPAALTTTVSWKTDSETDGQVWIGDAPDKIIQWVHLNIPDYTRDHTITIPNLNPNRTYYYQLISSDKSGHTSFSDVGSFRTANGSISDQLRTTLRPFASSALCFARANTPVVMVGVGLVVLVVGFGLLQIIRIARRRFSVKHP